MVARFLLRLSFVSLLGLLVVLGQRSYDCYCEYRDVQNAHHNLTAKIQDAKIEIVELALERDRLEKDPTYFEQLAREEFGMVRDNEVVYIVNLP